MSELTEMFDGFNREYFGGRLPRYRVRLAALTAEGILGHCDGRRRLIRLRRGLEGDGIRGALLHEMCHVGVSGHGPRFMRRLHRIARHEPAVATECRYRRVWELLRRCGGTGDPMLFVLGLLEAEVARRGL